MRLKDIEEGKRLLDRHMSGMHAGATDSLLIWVLTYAPALLAAAEAAASERARADKAEAEVERLREATQHLISEAHNISSLMPPNESDDWCISVREDDLRRLERAADLARAALKGKDND